MPASDRAKLSEFGCQIHEMLWPGKPPPPVDELTDTLCRAQLNGCSITDDQLMEIGSGVYVNTSLFNHSCEPSVELHCRGKVMQARCVRPVAAGDEVCLSWLGWLTRKD